MRTSRRGNALISFRLADDIIQKLFLIIISLSILEGCIQKRKEVEILIENNSDLKHSITLMSYLNDSLIDKRIVLKDSIADRYSKFKIEMPKSNTRFAKFNFKLIEGNEETKCDLNLDSITKSTKIYVNYVEILFKKGYQYKSTLLDKDTVIQKEFYCEIWLQ